jgi:anti-sigma B factor antagonist
MTEPPRSLKISESEGVTLVAFRDASILDAVTIQRVGQELYDLVESNDHRKIVLDFGNVRFLSSQTLGTLLTLKRKADQAKISVVFARLRPELHRVFEITNLNKLFRRFQTTDDAVAELAEL